MNRSFKAADRRRDQHLTFIERRKGRLWMYGEIGIFVFLATYLASHLLK
ncbi:MAG: hypothetical protein KGJ63_09795 [Pseudomonadota bacterium]|jgi:hypothetical protein|nr:hypothetical protein [Pseudomonadota bacterium]